MSSLTISPIGRIINNQNVKFKAGHQPEAALSDYSVLQLNPNMGFEDALKDLEGFDRIWLIFWFDRNQGWRPLVLPPRGPKQRRGVFSTRSPHRPNPVGLSAVDLISVDSKNLTITIGPCDLLENTPILDIKPYIPNYDSFPESKAGWVQEIDRVEKDTVPYEIVIEDLAKEQLHYLRTEHNVDFLEKAREVLSKDPTPHRTRRIYRSNKERNEYTMACGPWRLIYCYDVVTHCVRILRVKPGLPGSTLDRDFIQQKLEKELEIESKHIPNRPDFKEQHAFLEKYPQSGIQNGRD